MFFSLVSSQQSSVLFSAINLCVNPRSEAVCGVVAHVSCRGQADFQAIQCFEVAFSLSHPCGSSGVNSTLPEFSVSRTEKYPTSLRGFCWSESPDHTSAATFGVLGTSCPPGQSCWLSAQELPQYGSRVQTSGERPHLFC